MPKLFDEHRKKLNVIELALEHNADTQAVKEMASEVMADFNKLIIKHSGNEPKHRLFRFTEKKVFDNHRRRLMIIEVAMERDDFAPSEVRAMLLQEQQQFDMQISELIAKLNQESSNDTSTDDSPICTRVFKMTPNELIQELFKPHEEIAPQEDHGHLEWKFRLTSQLLNLLHPANHGEFGEFIWTLQGRNIVVICEAE